MEASRCTPSFGRARAYLGAGRRAGKFLADSEANLDMDILADLAHGWDIDGDGQPDDAELAYHYQGPVRRC